MALLKTPTKRVLILGGYGTFGSRIARLLSSESDCQFLIAGRDKVKAERFAAQLASEFGADCEGLGLDHNATNLTAQLKALKLNLLIHCAGPFQHQQYQVAEACIAAAVAYIDIADGRRYVCDFARLNAAPASISVPLISGASSLPALSSAVLKSLEQEFSEINSVDISIAPAHRIARGLATVRSGFEALGEGFPVLQNGEWRETFAGKQLLKVTLAHPVGRRLLSNFDIPDLELAPRAMPELHSVRFATGLQPLLLQLGLVLFAKLARLQIPATRPWIAKLGYKLAAHWPGGSPHGGMLIDLSGKSTQGSKITWRWQILGLNGDGPWIPAAPAAAMARKILHGEFQQKGAQSCWQLLTVDDILAELNRFAIVTSVEQIP